MFMTLPVVTIGGQENFLRRVVPWPTPDTSGVINLHWKGIGPDGNSYWGGRPHATAESFVGLVNWCLQRPRQIKDLYFCLSLQAKAGKNTKGKTTVVRSAEDAIALKAIWLDIDVKEPPKGYPTA